MRPPDECERCGHRKHDLPCAVRYLDSGLTCCCTEISEHPAPACPAEPPETIEDMIRHVLVRAVADAKGVVVRCRVCGAEVALPVRTETRFPTYPTVVE